MYGAVSLHLVVKSKLDNFFTSQAITLLLIGGTFLYLYFRERHLGCYKPVNGKVCYSEVPEFDRYKWFATKTDYNVTVQEHSDETITPLVVPGKGSEDGCSTFPKFSPLFFGNLTVLRFSSQLDDSRMPTCAFLPVPTAHDTISGPRAD